MARCRGLDVDRAVDHSRSQRPHGGRPRAPGGAARFAFSLRPRCGDPRPAPECSPQSASRNHCPAHPAFAVGPALGRTLSGPHFRRPQPHPVFRQSAPLDGLSRTNLGVPAQSASRQRDGSVGLQPEGQAADSGRTDLGSLVRLARRRVDRADRIDGIAADQDSGQQRQDSRPALCLGGHHCRRIVGRRRVNRRAAATGRFLLRGLRRTAQEPPPADRSLGALGTAGDLSVTAPHARPSRRPAIVRLDRAAIAAIRLARRKRRPRSARQDCASLSREPQPDSSFLV